MSLKNSTWSLIFLKILNNTMQTNSLLDVWFDSQEVFWQCGRHFFFHFSFLQCIGSKTYIMEGFPLYNTLIKTYPQAYLKVKNIPFLQSTQERKMCAYFLAKSDGPRPLFIHFLVILTHYTCQILEPNWKDKIIDTLLYFYFIFYGVNTVYWTLHKSQTSSLNLEMHVTE